MGLLGGYKDFLGAGMIFLSGFVDLWVVYWLSCHDGPSGVTLVSSEVKTNFLAASMISSVLI
jgi:hypothetical protein